MKQLTIYFSIDLEDQVIAGLERAGCQGFFRYDGMGVRFLEEGKVPRTISWEAAVISVPQIDDAAAGLLIGELEALIASCEVEPCIRIVVAGVERVV